MEKFRYIVYILLGKGYIVENENNGFYYLRFCWINIFFLVCVWVELVIYICVVLNGILFMYIVNCFYG